MSSLKLRRTPAADEHVAPLTAALVEVAENSFFGFVEPVDPARFEELAEPPVRWIRASVHFAGAFAGRMHVELPEPLAQHLFASFLGEPDDQPAAEGPLFDLVGELANMVCGTWLTRTCQRRQFNLQHPEVDVRPDGWRPAPAGIEAPILAAFNDAPVRLWLEFLPEA